MSAAPLAPGKAIIDSVCPAKVSRLTSISQPTRAAITATTLPASSALTMKWYSSSSPRSRARFRLSRGLVISEGIGMAVAMAGAVGVAVVMVGRGLGLADHHQAAVGGLQHLDRHAVERAERLAGDDLLDRPPHGPPAGQVEDPVDVG